jgi:hypothetical protein
MVRFNFPHSAITTWWKRELVRQERHWHRLLWGSEVTYVNKDWKKVFFFFFFVHAKTTWRLLETGLDMIVVTNELDT